jgi:hypothetical protein
VSPPKPTGRVILSSSFCRSNKLITHPQLDGADLQQRPVHTSPAAVLSAHCVTPKIILTPSSCHLAVQTNLCHTCSLMELTWGHCTASGAPEMLASLQCRHTCQGLACCGRTQWSVCLNSSAPATTTSGGVQGMERRSSELDRGLCRTEQPCMWHAGMQHKQQDSAFYEAQHIMSKCDLPHPSTAKSSTCSATRSVARPCVGMCSACALFVHDVLVNTARAHLEQTKHMQSLPLVCLHTLPSCCCCHPCFS